jgi:mono/diheme cytochrome c family protein
MMAPRFPCLALLVLAAPLAAQDGNERARTLFVTNCASCHGETGDGHGTAELDRPARSFQDGGFSFGNTPEALFKTISTGIPGSPMAGFDSSLSEEERRILAAYVVTLGPPVEEVKDEDMVLAVHERPLVVRGHLPPLGEGLPPHPRGLLIGDPSGITFEYDVADVRLLALRQGGFVKRTDWSGRGGTPLEPLGKVVQLVGSGKPAPIFSLAAGSVPLAAHLAATEAADQVRLAYHLLRGTREVAHVVETPRVQAMPFGTGYTRRFAIVCGAQPVHLAVADPTQGPGDELMEFDTSSGDAYGGIHLAPVVRRQADGSAAYHALAFESRPATRAWGVLVVDLKPGEATWIEITTVPLGAWTKAVRKQLESLDR